jgi:voltage-gated potassium channel
VRPLFLSTYQTRWHHGSRYLRAVSLNSRTLLREFRRPLLAFVLVTLVGGFMYGELHQFSGRSPIALVDRPYIMLQLMILETPYDAPSEWYLVLFWYLLPPIFVFIVGNGVADFVRLFFDRSGRQDAWRKALIATMQHHVIVFGVGHVGLRVVKLLHDLNVDVIAIDNSPDEGVEEQLSVWKIPLINGDGTLLTTLQDAGIASADAFVACTGNDPVNLQSIMRARGMNRDIRIVVRVWDNLFAREIEEFMHVQSILSSSDLSAPAFAGQALGVEITQSLRIDNVDYNTVRLTVFSLAGLTVGQIQGDYKVDVVLHGRQQQVAVQPAHDIILQAGDTVVLFAPQEDSLKLAMLNRNGR